MTSGIALIHLGRCGSTVLGKLLDQHSRITWYGEVVEPYLRKARQLHGDAFFLTGDPVILGRRKLESCTTDFCGVEFKPFHLTAFRTTSASFIPAMRESGFQHFIVLDRRNRLRKIVSSRLAARTGVWHVPAGTLRNGDRIAIDVDNFQLDRKHGTLVEVLKMYDAEFDELRRLLAPDYLDLVYEDHIERAPQVAYRMVVDYLGLSSDPVTVTLGRTTMAPLRDLIENYEAVAAHLSGTNYAWMLEG